MLWWERVTSLGPCLPSSVFVNRGVRDTSLGERTERPNSVLSAHCHPKCLPLLPRASPSPVQHIPLLRPLSLQALLQASLCSLSVSSLSSCSIGAGSLRNVFGSRKTIPVMRFYTWDTYLTCAPDKPRSPHPSEDPPPRTTSSSQPHKTLSRPFVGVLSTTCEAVVDDDVNSITRDHRTGLGRSGGTVDEPRPTMHGNEGVLNETLGVSGGDDVHSQTYNMPSNHRRPLDRFDSSDNNNTELAPKSRRVDSGRMEDVEEPAVGSGEPKNGMGLDSSALSPLINGTGRCVDAPPAYESAWAVERRVGAGWIIGNCVESLSLFVRSGYLWLFFFGLSVIALSPLFVTLG